MRQAAAVAVAVAAADAVVAKGLEKRKTDEVLFDQYAVLMVVRRVCCGPVGPSWRFAQFIIVVHYCFFEAIAIAALGIRIRSNHGQFKL